MKGPLTHLLFVLALPLALLAAGDVTASAEPEGGHISRIADQFGVGWKTLIPSAVNFCLAATVLYFLAVKPVSETLEARQQKISDGLQYAEEMKTQLAQTERERAETMKRAAIEVQAMLAEAREQSKELIEQKTLEAANQAEAIIRKAGKATELERQKMISEVRQEVARLVVATSSKVLARNLSAKEKVNFSKSAVRELAETELA